MAANILLLLSITPLLGVLVILGLPSQQLRTVSNKNIDKEIALIFSLITFWISIYIWIKFDNGNPEFQMVQKLDWMPLSGTTFLLGIDGISLFFILLTTLLIPICILSSWDSVKHLTKEFVISLLILESLLIIVFLVLDLISFYIFFESTLIPMLLIIAVWGSRKEKIQAAYYLFIYTLIGSVLMLLGIFYLYYEMGTTDYQILLNSSINENVQKLLWLAFFASFAVKIPMVPFHIWLPQAHTEAHLSGSIVLAGILLKLGGYGFLRFSLPLFPVASIYFTPLIFVLSAIAIIYASLTTLRQIDLKRIIAYSSVSHMGLVTLAIFTQNIIGIEASIFLMIAHGITSSALFICVTVLYDKFHTRIIKYYRGIAITMPLFAIIFSIFSLANLGLPLTANFVGEFLVLLTTYQINPFIALLATTGVIFSAAYSLFLYNRVSFGSISPYIAFSSHNRDITRRDFYIFLPLVFLVFFLGIYPDIILNPLHASVYNLIYNINV